MNYPPNFFEELKVITNNIPDGLKYRVIDCVEVAVMPIVKGKDFEETLTTSKITIEYIALLKEDSAPGVLKEGFYWILQDFEEEGVAVEENGWRHWKEEQKLGGGAHQGQSGRSKTTGATDL
ncbi:hypothetical protein BY996DRAFT_6580520 [Phakopsora pachyrhizi]|nr:hypothetical protein BY996DRAFT_6580520 [Phakopsora pachyrhizi]